MPNYYIAAGGSDIVTLLDWLSYYATNTAYYNFWVCAVPGTGIAIRTGEAYNSLSTIPSVGLRIPVRNTESYKYGTTVFLGYVTCSELAPVPSQNWSSVAGGGTEYHMENINSMGETASLCFCLNTFRLTRLGQITRCSSATQPTYVVNSDLQLPIQISGGAISTLASPTGIKPNFFKATVITDAFENPSELRKDIRGSSTNTSMISVVLSEAGTAVIYGLFVQFGPPVILDLKAASDVSAFWGAATNPETSYENLWNNFPTLMPTLGSQVYQMREMQAINTNLGLVSTAVTETKDLLSAQTLALEGMSDAITGAFGPAGTLTASLQYVHTDAELLEAAVNNVKMDITGQLSTGNVLTGQIATSMGNIETNLGPLGHFHSAANDLHAVVEEVKNQIQSHYMTMGTFAATQNTVLLDILTAFSAAFGSDGTLVQAVSNGSVPATTLINVMDRILQGKTRAEIAAEFPRESLQYARDIDVLLKLSPDQIREAGLNMLSAMSANGNVLTAYANFPELVPGSGEVTVLDMLSKTGAYSR